MYNNQFNGVPMNYINTQWNPYLTSQNQTQIIKVNGENGAKAYQMAPNSSVLLLDESNPIVWLAQTDGAGYKTVSPYKIEPYVAEPEPDYNDILTRLKKLEERVDAKSNFAGNKQQRKQTEQSAE